MKIQKSYIDNVATLYLVPTPIGNYDDMTYRSVEVLKEVSYVFCEDTRITKVLFSHFNIKTPLLKYRLFNEEIESEQILSYLKQGLNIALVSDAGLPGISDPGFYVSRKAIDEGYNVVSLPGASASLTALIASGLPCDRFFFQGFLNSKQSQRIKQLEEIKNKKETIIIYEAPHRIKETLKDIYSIFGNRHIVIARELTKKYEEYIRFTLDEIDQLDFEIKGEIVLIIEATNIDSEIKELNNLTVLEHYNYYFDITKDEKESIKKVAKDRSVSKSEIYKIIKVNNKE